VLLMSRHHIAGFLEMNAADKKRFNSSTGPAPVAPRAR
jgi:hypothetical protein